MTNNDFDRTARLWLEGGPTELADRALDAALDEIHVTPQRRAWWPARRLPKMTTPIRFATGAATLAVVVLVLAVVGFNLLPGNGGVGAPSSTPAPTGVVAPTSSSGLRTSPGALTVTSGGPVPIQAGTYTAADPFLLKATFTVPAGWEGNIGGPYAVFLQQTQGPGAVSFSILERVYADPCHSDKGFLDPLPGPSVDDLATALAHLPGVTATTPTAVALGGYQGKQLTLTAPASSTGCTGSYLGIWELPLGATNDLTSGEIDRVWILDVGGQRLVIDALQAPGESTATTAEVQAILDSIVIGQGPAGPWPMTSASGAVTGPLTAGTYTAADPFLLKATFTVPAGWGGNIGGPYAVFLQQTQGPGAVSFSIFDKVYADPCHYNGLLAPLPGPSVDDLATALAHLPGVTATTPTAVALGGYPGKQLTLTAPASFSACTLTPDGAFRIWELPLGATNDMVAGEVDRVWILDVDGQRLVIDAPQLPGESAATIAEVQAIVASIGIAQLT
jgi:hypothetical protein